MEVKIRTEKEEYTNTRVVKFYANDILVCECVTGHDYYCSIKKGVPSTIRTIWGRTYRTLWNQQGLRTLIGNVDAATFKDDYPNFSYGYKGSVLTAKKVKELIFKQMDLNH